MIDSDKNLYSKCLRVMCSDLVLKPYRTFVNLKILEDRHPKECEEIRKSLKVKYNGII